MKSRTSRRPWLLLPVGDVLIVVGVFVLGYWLRHFVLSGLLNSLFGMTADFRLSASQYLVSGGVMGLVEVIMLQAFGVYRREFGLAHIEELAWILRSSFMAVVITFAFSFATRQLFFSRFVLLFAFPSTAILVAVWHRIFHLLVRNAARREGRVVSVVVYGTGELARDLARFMETRALVPYRVSGFVQPEGSTAEPVEEPTVPGGDALFEYMAENGVTELIVADTTIPRRESADLIYRCEQEGIAYKLVADVFALVSLTTRVVHMGGTTMIESVPPPLTGSKRFWKRSADLVLSIVLAVLLLPLGILTAAAIVVSSGFPVFYVQTRLGEDNRPFRMLKFRSMRRGAHSELPGLADSNEATGPLFKMKSDPRVTAVGRIIRKWSIDELPQLLNVIAGQMSLVGPRPPIPEEVEAYSQKHMKRLQTIPGITGVWQISGRSSLGFEEMVKLDLYYVDNWSVWMDLAILLITPLAILSRSGAY